MKILHWIVNVKIGRWIKKLKQNKQDVIDFKNHRHDWDIKNPISATKYYDYYTCKYPNCRTIVSVDFYNKTVEKGKDPRDIK